MSQLTAKPELPWDRFSRWVHCICVVTFDTEIGQSIELIYPAHRQLSEKEKMSVCYLSFPDSNSGCLGDTQYNFRFRKSVDCAGTAIESASAALSTYDLTCHPALQRCPYLYGHTYFRQTKDKSVKRGYFQKSIVIVTRLPLNNLFTHLVSHIAQEFFDNGEPSIEAACHDIDQWPAPAPGVTQYLPFLGNVLQICVPPNDEASRCLAQLSNSHNQQLLNVSKRDADSTIPLSASSSTSLSRSSAVSLPIEPEPLENAGNLIRIGPVSDSVDLYAAFAPLLRSVQLCWELALTNEPCVVMAPTPTDCATLVNALVSLIWPLRFGADYRPYFTVHDCEFREYTQRVQPCPAVLLGVTNPFFAKTLQHFPHVLRVDETSSNRVGSKPLKKLIKSGTPFGNGSSNGGSVTDAKPGVHTDYKPFIERDKSLIKQVEARVSAATPSGSSNSANPNNRSRIIAARKEASDVLRNYFARLTQSFIIPLERYVSTLMPLHRRINAFRPLPALRAFDADELLRAVEQHGPEETCGVRGDWKGLYRKFLKSANFLTWYSHKLKEINIKLQLLHIDAICQADVQSWSKGKSEIEIVDFLIVLTERLQFITRHACLFGTANESRRAQLQAHYDVLLQLLPTDLRASILRNASCTLAVRPSSADEDPDADADALAVVLAQTATTNDTSSSHAECQQNVDADNNTELPTTSSSGTCILPLQTLNTST